MTPACPAPHAEGPGRWLIPGKLTNAVGHFLHTAFNRAVAQPTSFGHQEGARLALAQGLRAGLCIQGILGSNLCSEDELPDLGPD